jgi:hypothetical protein
MGSKSLKWLTASLAAASLAGFPAGAGAVLDYSQNSVNGEVQGALPMRLDYSRNSVSGEVNPASTAAPSKPAAPVVVRSAQSDRGFAWGDALAGGGIALLLAFSGIAIVRRRHPSPLAS